MPLLSRKLLLVGFAISLLVGIIPFLSFEDFLSTNPDQSNFIKYLLSGYYKTGDSLSSLLTYVASSLCEGSNSLLNSIASVFQSNTKISFGVIQRVITVPTLSLIWVTLRRMLERIFEVMKFERYVVKNRKQQDVIL
jgi:hypothetical protein